MTGPLTKLIRSGHAAPPLDLLRIAVPFACHHRDGDSSPFNLSGAVATLVLAGALFAQTHDQSQSHTASHSQITTPSGATILPGGVDGSLNPELIPDSVAYRLFLMTMAEPRNAGSEQQSRQRRKLERAQLSDSDLAALIPILTDFLEQQQAVEQASAIRTDAAAADALETSRNSVTSGVRTRIAASLSPAGATRLDQLIQAEKRHMAIYPYPQHQ